MSYSVPPFGDNYGPGDPNNQPSAPPLPPTAPTPYSPPAQNPPYSPPAQQPPYSPPGQNGAYSPPTQNASYSHPAQQPPYSPPPQNAPYPPPAQQPPYSPPAQPPPYSPPAQNQPYPSTVPAGHQPNQTPSSLVIVQWIEYGNVVDQVQWPLVRRKLHLPSLAQRLRATAILLDGDIGLPCDNQGFTYMEFQENQVVRLTGRRESGAWYYTKKCFKKMGKGIKKTFGYIIRYRHLYEDAKRAARYMASDRK